MKPAPAKALWHGGVPGLDMGDLIEPGHSRDHNHPGCKWCAARAAGTATHDMTSARRDRVYCTTHRLYAKFHASLYGHGDLYRVEAVGDVERSEEDKFPSFVAPALRVVVVFARDVLLSPGERTAIYVEWAKRDGVSKRQAYEDLRRLATTAGSVIPPEPRR